jgi:hypothetical protein
MVRKVLGGVPREVLPGVVQRQAEAPPDERPRLFPSHTIRGRRYCIKNLYATINATMLAKISSAGSDFRIIGLVEWRAADRLG